MPRKPLAELRVPSVSPGAGGLLGPGGAWPLTAATGAQGGGQAHWKEGSAGQAREVTDFMGASTRPSSAGHPASPWDLSRKGAQGSGMAERARAPLLPHRPGPLW